MGSKLAGIVRQLALMVATIVSILLYLAVSWLKKISVHVRPWKAAEYQCDMRMERAKTYEEWKEAAREHDHITHKELWKSDPHSQFYNASMISTRLQALREARERGDWISCMYKIRENLVRGIGGLGNQMMFTYCKLGTKQLIEEYIEEVTTHLNFIANNHISGVSLAIKERFFADSRQAFGRSALLLSGGGSLGMVHFGVVKCLFEHNLLPPVICGTSIGALLAALLAIHSDDELVSVLSNPNLINFKAFAGLKAGSARRKIARLLKYGVLMDIHILEQFCKDNIPNITFQEAFNKTKRIVNIVVTHPAPGTPSVLNHITSPNVLLWSAACVSCFQPGLYERLDLMAKDFDGATIRFVTSMHGSGLESKQREELPMIRMSQLFNVDHFIVSQVNPHLVAAARATKSSSRSRLVHRIMMAFGNEIQHWLSQIVRINLLPRTFEWFKHDFMGKFQGHITIVPNLSLTTISRALSNPSALAMKKSILEGERAVFPLISEIEMRCKIERLLHDCTVKIRAEMAKTEATQDQDGHQHHVLDYSRFLSVDDRRYSPLPPFQIANEDKDANDNNNNINSNGNGMFASNGIIGVAKPGLDREQSVFSSVFSSPAPPATHEQQEDEAESLADVTSSPVKKSPDGRTRAFSFGRSAVPVQEDLIPRTPPRSITPTRYSASK